MFRVGLPLTQVYVGPLEHKKEAFIIRVFLLSFSMEQNQVKFKVD